MPRFARIIIPNCPHHIVQRGHNRSAVFIEPRDYRFYLGNLAEWKYKLDLKIFAWCLMTNHIHIIAEPSDESGTLSEMMKRVNGRQTAFVNKSECRSGTLWTGRFKASPIQSNNYLLKCCRYVELNPIRAGMVNYLQDYPWSSYRQRIGLEAPDLLDMSESYLALGEKSEERAEQYRKFVTETISDQEYHFIRSSVMRNQLTGNSRFIDEIEVRIGRRIEHRGRGRPRKDN